MNDGSARPEDPETGPDPLIGTVIADRYRVDDRLGTGGMGAVYRAEHVLMKKAVAVKVLHREMTALEEVVKRFEREAIAAGRIEHPNVAVATDFGKLEDGSFYLVLEYVPGRSLTDVLAEGALPAERALFIARQVASALGAAHAAGIVHRDLKPDNIMLIDRGGTTDFVKVLDFGIAKVSSEHTGGNQLTQLGAVFGTPAYMSPEQAAGQAVDPRADLYALGLVLHEMLAGHAVFESDDMVALLMKQLTEPPPPLPDTVDAKLAALVMQLLQKDPKDRVQSAAELVVSIDACLGPLALPPDSSAFGPFSARVVPAPAAAPAPVSPLPPLGGGAPPSSTRAGALFATVLAVAPRPSGLRLAGRDVPRWLVVAAAVVVLALALALHHRHSTALPVGHRAAPPPVELAPIIARAKVGDRAAIAQLEARPATTRTAAEWMALGKGHAVFAEYGPALLAFRHAVTLDPPLASDAGMLADVRRAADDDSAQKDALDLAAGPLMASGADLLFDVWASTNDKTQATILAKSLLDRDDVEAHGSPALRVALDLRRATKCDDVKNLLPAALADADERSVRRLTQLATRRGCGFLGLGDCYPCLRSDDQLSDALKAAQTRKAPRF